MGKLDLPGLIGLIASMLSILGVLFGGLSLAWRYSRYPPVAIGALLTLVSVGAAYAVVFLPALGLDDPYSIAYTSGAIGLLIAFVSLLAMVYYLVRPSAGTEGSAAGRLWWVGVGLGALICVLAFVFGGGTPYVLTALAPLAFGFFGPNRGSPRRALAK